MNTSDFGTAHIGGHKQFILYIYNIYNEVNIVKTSVNLYYSYICITIHKKSLTKYLV